MQKLKKKWYELLVLNYCIVFTSADAILYKYKLVLAFSCQFQIVVKYVSCWWQIRKIGKGVWLPVLNCFIVFTAVDAILYKYKLVLAFSCQFQIVVLYVCKLLMQKFKKKMYELLVINYCIVFTSADAILYKYKLVLAFSCQFQIVV